MKEIQIKYANGKSIEITKNGRIYTIKLTTGKTVRLEYLGTTFFYKARVSSPKEKKQIRMAEKILYFVDDDVLWCGLID